MIDHGKRDGLRGLRRIQFALVNAVPFCTPAAKKHPRNWMSYPALSSRLTPDDSGGGENAPKAKSRVMLNSKIPFGYISSPRDSFLSRLKAETATELQ